VLQPLTQPLAGNPSPTPGDVTRNLLPQQTQVATVLTMITVDPDDPAFARPTKFVGPIYQQDAAEALAAEKSWTFRPDGNGSPETESGC